MRYSLSPDVIALNEDVLGGETTASVRTKAGGYRSLLEKQAAESWIALNLAWSLYEPFTLNFPGGHYKPDFFGPWRLDSGLVIIEVKGWNKNIRADQLKYRVAAEHHRWAKFCWLTWKDGDWDEKWYAFK